MSSACTVRCVPGEHHHDAMLPRSSAPLMVLADTIEVSREHERLALYQWQEVEFDGGRVKSAWCEGTTRHSAGTMYALLDLAQRAGLTVAAWKDGERL